MRLQSPNFSTQPAGVGHSGHLSSDALRNAHDPPASKAGVSHKTKYQFDVNGYIVLRKVFSPERVKVANEAIDKHMGTLHERKGKLRTSGLYGRQSGPLQGDGETGRFDMGGMLGWDKPFCDPFREVLTHPTIAAVLSELLGVGYRLDHSPLMIAMEKGSEGHTLHGGSITESGEPAWPLMYDCRNGMMRNQLLTVCLQLHDAAEGDGGFCVVPGSHKANFAVPPELADLADPDLNEHVRQPALAPGDVLIFTEAVLHGTLPWTADHQRRTIIYRFAPPGSAYGRGYLASAPPDDAFDDGNSTLWPKEFTEGMDKAQLAVMLPPYHPRMNRPYVDGETGEAVQAKAREPWKVEFDEKVFNTRYF